MHWLLFLLFIVVPVIEIALFIQVGGLIGLWPTLGMIILTAALGAALLRQQGLATLVRFRQRLDQNELPATELLEGIILLVCGAFLLTPGFFTDTIGFLMLVPAIRGSLVRWILSRGTWVFGMTSAGPAGSRVYRHPDGHHTIEGEYRRED